MRAGAQTRPPRARDAGRGGGRCPPGEDSLAPRAYGGGSPDWTDKREPPPWGFTLKLKHVAKGQSVLTAVRKPGQVLLRGQERPREACTSAFSATLHGPGLCQIPPGRSACGSARRSSRRNRTIGHCGGKGPRPQHWNEGPRRQHRGKGGLEREATFQVTPVRSGQHLL